jgi:predicted HTH domain antitoxin
MMVEKRTARAGQGTFAKLYDVQEELSQRNVKPLGRPRKKIRRKPTTVHLTQVEMRNLSKTHLLVSEYVSVNRSELVGIAVDALACLIEEKGENFDWNDEVRDVDALREAIVDFIKS